MAAGALGASLATLPLGGGPIVAGALGGGVYGLTYSSASGDRASRVLGNTVYYAGVGGATGGLFKLATPALAPLASRLSPYAIDASAAIVSRLPDPIRRKVFAGVLDVSLQSGIQRYAADTARQASLLATRSFVANRGIVRGVAPARAEYLRAQYGHLTTAQRRARIAELSEANYARRIHELELSLGTPNVHSLQKHGAQTTFLSQFRRVQQLNYPNPTTGLTGNPTKNASRFLSNRDHFETLTRAINQQVGVFKPTITVQFDRAIGVTVRNLGTHSNRGPFSINLTNQAVVRFDPNTQRFFTAYPEP